MVPMPSSRRSRRRPYEQEYRPLDLERASGGRRQDQRDGVGWTVQSVRSSDKAYRCPWCNQEVAPGTPHVVAWANESLFGAQAALDARRHWHTGCWDSGR